QGQRRSVAAGHGQLPSTEKAVVLDVGVDGERIVQELDGCRGRQGVAEASTEGLARRQAETRPQRLARATGIVGERQGEVVDRPVGSDEPAQFLADDVPVPGQAGRWFCTVAAHAPWRVPGDNPERQRERHAGKVLDKDLTVVHAHMRTWGGGRPYEASL